MQQRSNQNFLSWVTWTSESFKKDKKQQLLLDTIGHSQRQGSLPVLIFKNEK